MGRVIINLPPTSGMKGQIDPKAVRWPSGWQVSPPSGGGWVRVQIPPETYTFGYSKKELARNAKRPL